MIYWLEILCNFCTEGIKNNCKCLNEIETMNSNKLLNRESVTFIKNKLIVSFLKNANVILNTQCLTHIPLHRSVQFNSVTQSCLTLSDPMDCRTPGLPVHHQLQEFTLTHVHWVSDAIKPSHPPSSPSPAFKLSQHQGVFKWVSSSHQVAKILAFKLQHQSFQWTITANLPLGRTGWISLQSKGLLKVFSNTTVQKHQFFCAQLSL